MVQKSRIFKKTLDYLMLNVKNIWTEDFQFLNQCMGDLHVILSTLELQDYELYAVACGLVMFYGYPKQVVIQNFIVFIHVSQRFR